MELKVISFNVFCFIDEKVTPVSQKIMTETVDGKYPSDHYGLFIELKI